MFFGRGTIRNHSLAATIDGVPRPSYIHSSLHTWFLKVLSKLSLVIEFSEVIVGIAREGGISIMAAVATMLTINEAAALADGLSAFRVRQMCIEGVLPHIKCGKKYLINKKKLFEVIGESSEN